MTDWTSGYVADLDYTFEFTKELAPSHLALCATSKGQKHRLTRPGLTYCELGCGQGYSANLLAAANPQAEFHAMDFNPAHIAGARDLAEEAGLDNIRFYEHSFETFAEAPGLPQEFDVIALHGVYSWVSEENRRLITDFISARLRSGGMVYISYNTQPGWAAAMPLRRILADHAAQSSGPLEDRITAALEHACALRDAGAGYFTANPALGEKLDSLKTMSRNYLAHEYFNRDWTPFHFRDVAGSLGGAKLGFLGSSNLLDHVEGTCFTMPQLLMLEAESDPVRRQGLGDVFSDQQFRADIFSKGALAQTERGAVAAWFDTPLTLARHYTGAPLKPVWRQGEITVDHAVYDPLLRVLAQGPATVRSLMEQDLFGMLSWAEITGLLNILAGCGQIAPCLPAEGLEARTLRCRAFNRAVARRSEESGHLGFFASPVTGSGVALNRMEQLFLTARSEGHETPEDWAALAWRILEPQGQRMQHNGAVLESPEENLAVLRARANAFAATRLPVCKALGITLDTPRKEAARNAA